MITPATVAAAAAAAAAAGGGGAIDPALLLLQQQQLGAPVRLPLPSVPSTSIAGGAVLAFLSVMGKLNEKKKEFDKLNVFHTRAMAVMASVAPGEAPPASAIISPAMTARLTTLREDLMSMSRTAAGHLQTYLKAVGIVTAVNQDTLVRYEGALRANLGTVLTTGVVGVGGGVGGALGMCWPPTLPTTPGPSPCPPFPWEKWLLTCWQRKGRGLQRRPVQLPVLQLPQQHCSLLLLLSPLL